jgi:hypothetical protein
MWATQMLTAQIQKMMVTVMNKALKIWGQRMVRRTGRKMMRLQRLDLASYRSI